MVEGTADADMNPGSEPVTFSLDQARSCESRRNLPGWRFLTVIRHYGILSASPSDSHSIGLKCPLKINNSRRIESEDTMFHRIIAGWVYGGFAAGLLLLLLSPLFVHGWPAALASAYFCLPAYMLHQYEEHDNDRFRVFMNQILAGGREVLTLTAVFIINIPGVWGVTAVSLLLAAYVHPGLALIAVYLPLLNAIIHIAQAAAARRYNPGLVTAVVLFLPICGWCLKTIRQSGYGTGAMHAIGLAVALAIHVIIAVAVLSKRRLLAST